jgi:hypothetical protein
LPANSRLGLLLSASAVNTFSKSIWSAVVFPLIYFLPTLIARARHRIFSLPVIGLVNLLVGWTVVGWIALLVWVLRDEAAGSAMSWPDPVVFDTQKDRTPYQDPEARPEIVALFEKQGGAEVVHEESGVRGRVQRLGTGEDAGYWLAVPTGE